MKYTSMLPFLDNDDLNELSQKILNGEITTVKLVTLYPFVNNDTMNQIVDTLIEQGKGRQLTKTLPFLSKDKVNELYERVNEKPIEGFNDEMLLPFLGKGKVKDMFYSFLQKNEKESSETDDTKSDE